MFMFADAMAADQIGSNRDANVISTDGESVTLSCPYDTSSRAVRLYWYRQYPNTEPQYLIWKDARYWSGTGTPADPRFQSTTSQSSTELIITGVTLSDSALYYCALRVGAQWYKVYVKPYKNSNYFFSLKLNHIKTTICYTQKLINYGETSASLSMARIFSKYAMLKKRCLCKHFDTYRLNNKLCIYYCLCVHVLKLFICLSQPAWYLSYYQKCYGCALILHIFIL